MKGTNFIVSWFNKFKKHQKTLFAFLIGIIVFNFYFNIFHKSKAIQLYRLKLEIRTIDNQIKELKAQMPNADKERWFLKGILDEHRKLETEVDVLRAQLFSRQGIPQFLGELARQAKGLDIDFISIKTEQFSSQQTEVKQEAEKEYTYLDIELNFDSDYFGLVNYLNRLESLSPFLIVRQAAVKQNEKKDFQNNMNLFLSILIDESLRSEYLRKKGETKEVSADFIAQISFERDPFRSDFKTLKRVQQRSSGEYALEGITLKGEQSTAIINGEVYSIGDTLEDLRVSKILPNMVVLTSLRENALSAKSSNSGQETIILLEKELKD